MKINKPNKFAAIACSTLLAVATTGLSQNLLTNPGFESDAPGTLTTGWSTNNAGTTSSAYARSGSKSLLIDSTGVGQWWSPNAFQTNSASAGEVYNLKGYMFTPTTIAGTSFGLFKIEFRDAANVILQPAGVTIGTSAGAPFFGGESTPFMNSSSTTNTWIFSQTQAVAPANTASVWFYALNVNQVDNIMYFDDIEASLVTVVPLNAQITSPPDGALRPTDFLITANASVGPGTISSVTLYDGPALVSTLTTAPYEWLVSGFAVGNHPLTVVATSSGGASVTSSVVNVTVSTEVNVTVDPTKTWLGYMNVLESLANPTNSLGFVYGSGWATADLRAAFCGTKLILSPNTINDPAPFWYVTTNSPSIGNKTMNANFYVEPAGSLPGQLVTFSGTVQSSTLLNVLNPANQGWTVVAFIKDFAPDYSAFSESTFPITGNGAFSLQLQTSFNAGNHVQYGFTVQGPCVWPTDPALAGYGNVQIELSSPVAPAAPTITSSLSGGNLNLAFPTEGCYAYTVLVKTNLTDLTWSTLTVTNGTGATAVVSTPASGGSRFFRVSAQ